MLNSMGPPLQLLAVMVSSKSIQCPCNASDSTENPNARELPALAPPAMFETGAADKAECAVDPFHRGIALVEKHHRQTHCVVAVDVAIVGVGAIAAVHQRADNFG